MAAGRRENAWKTLPCAAVPNNLLATISMVESKYIERKGYLSRYAPEQTKALRAAQARRANEFCEDEDYYRSLREELPRFVPFLTERCGVEFWGRVLEIGAGGAWLSAELSKLPRVVEVVTTDFSPELLKEKAPKVFAMLKAKTTKITRTPADFHQLDFPENHFDFVVSSAVLHHAANIVQVLREAKRVLKPGGQLVSIREPVWPLVKIKSREKMLARLVATGVDERFYTLADYKEFFRQAAFPMAVKRINLATGFKYYLNAVVNGLTHARYAFVATKRGAAARPRPKTSLGFPPRPGPKPARP
jgi:ubiquinone/menaquinone biosynthesis C-methylase UbiE